VGVSPSHCIGLMISHDGRYVEEEIVMNCFEYYDLDLLLLLFAFDSIYLFIYLFIYFVTYFVLFCVRSVADFFRSVRSRYNVKDGIARMNVPVKTGKWYFECEVGRTRYPRLTLGWCSQDFRFDVSGENKKESQQFSVVIFGMLLLFAYMCLHHFFVLLASPYFIQSQRRSERSAMHDEFGKKVRDSHEGVVQVYLDLDDPLIKIAFGFNGEYLGMHLLHSCRGANA
jgi:hypothetical protein